MLDLPHCLMRTADERAFTSGSTFNYSNIDTLALGLLVKAATNERFAKYFERTVWADSGAQSSGAWIITNRKQPSTYQGFSATPHDWIRLGLMVLNELRNSDSCFGKYVKDLSRKQINSYGPARVWLSNLGQLRCGNRLLFCWFGRTISTFYSRNQYCGLSSRHNAILGSMRNTSRND